MAVLRDGVTYGEIILAALRRFPERIAFRQDARTLTYAKTADLLALWVTVFARRGLKIGRGHRGPVAEPSGGLPRPVRRRVFAGGRYTALHPLGSLDDHRYACDEAELRFLLVDPAYAERAARLLEVRVRPARRSSRSGPPRSARTSTRLPDAVTPGDRSTAGPHGPDDIAWLLYTGGTTGVPKAAMLPERAIAQMVFSVLSGWDLPSDMRYLACAPISHAAGMLLDADAAAWRHGLPAAVVRSRRVAGGGGRRSASRSACSCRR